MAAPRLRAGPATAAAARATTARTPRRPRPRPTAGATATATRPPAATRPLRVVGERVVGGAAARKKKKKERGRRRRLRRRDGDSGDRVGRLARAPPLARPQEGEGRSRSRSRSGAALRRRGQAAAPRGKARGARRATRGGRPRGDGEDGVREHEAGWNYYTVTRQLRPREDKIRRRRHIHTPGSSDTRTVPARAPVICSPRLRPPCSMQIASRFGAAIHRASTALGAVAARHHRAIEPKGQDPFAACCHGAELGDALEITTFDAEFGCCSSSTQASRHRAIPSESNRERRAACDRRRGASAFGREA